MRLCACPRAGSHWLGQWGCLGSGRSRAARDMVAHSLIEAGFKAPASPQQVRKRMRGVL